MTSSLRSTCSSTHQILPDIRREYGGSLDPIGLIANMPDPADENEWLTRKRRINPKLRALGWNVVPYDPGTDISTFDAHAVEEFPTTNGPADYGLVVDGQLVGVVEAKKVTVGPAGVLRQAERYSKGVDNGTFNFRGFRGPFLYSTNGEFAGFMTFVTN